MAHRKNNKAFTTMNKDHMKLIAVVVLIIVLELQNTAIERLCDRITTDFDEVIRIVKDCSSASVFLGALMAGVLWSIYLLEKFGYI